MEKGRGLFVKLEFPWINEIIFVLNNRWTRSTALGPCPAVVHGGPAVDGSTELAEAWPPVAPGLKGAGQGAEDGETGSGNLLWASLEGGRRRGGQTTEGTATAVGVPVRGSLELRERQRRERGGAVLSGGAPGGFYRAGEGAHAPGDGEEWAEALTAVVRRLSEVGEAVVANKGGVREEGTVGQLLTMALERGGGLMRRGRSAKDGGTRRSAQGRR
jgi:hypothetical protein